MKKRHGFVSNSSSSSYICEVCGESGSGYDASPSDFDMATCRNGHTFCYAHAIDPDTPCTVTHYDGSTAEYDNMYDAETAEEYEVPSQYCPICSFKKMSSCDYQSYLKKTNRGIDAIFKEVKNRFSSYEEFQAFLKEKNV